MPVLNWIGKDAVVRHDAEVPFRLLHDVPELACGDADSGNLIVEGDNLLALKALLPHYGGQVKCIYIDPPYNTGNEGWIYNDNVNSPQMREWLGKVVGKEAEDLTRHDKWLCMMYPRLKLLKRFLREDGVIFVSIDDNEVAALRMLMDEVFGPQNFVATAIWNMMDSPKNSAKYLSEDHEYITIFAADKSTWRPHALARTEEMIARYKNPDDDPRGPWLLSDLAARNFYAQGRYSIKTPSGKIIEGPPSGSYWRVNEQKFWELDRDNRIWWGKQGSNRPGIKRFLSDVKGGVVPRTLWPWREVGSTRHSKQEVSQVMNLGASSDLFVTPKPTTLIQRILQIASDKDSLVLDSFAGSGTTAHAVLKQNVEDGGNRRCILVEMDSNIASNVTAERVKRVAQGYTNAKGEAVAGLGGSFRYATLGKPLFDAEGHYINPEVRFAELARFVWFMETGVPLATKRPDSPLLGVHEGRAVYLLYNGILKDKSTGSGNVLTSPLLAELREHDGLRTIYGTRCLIKPERLRALRIVFKQLPHELKVAR